MVRQWQTLLYGSRYSSTDPKRRTDYVKLAEGFGAKGYHCTTPAEFKAAFLEALSNEGPSWIECVIDKDEKVLPMIPAGATIEDIILADGKEA
jgi:acetolactate synthase-1/2/3 large subunit